MGALIFARLFCPVGVLGTALGHSSGVGPTPWLVCCEISGLLACLSYSLGLIENLKGFVAGWLRFEIVLLSH